MTLTHYEVAWNIHQAGSTISQICQVVGKHRATVYRWLKKIRQIGIRLFLKRKQTYLLWHDKHSGIIILFESNVAERT